MRFNEWLKGIKRNLRIFFHSIFFGLRGGDKKLLNSSTQSLTEDSHYEQDVIVDSVFNDLLQEEETQRVKETRDATYRVYREANKYIVTGDFGDNVGEFAPTIAKKSKTIVGENKYLYDNDSKDIFLIQDQEIFENDSCKKAEEANLGYTLEPDERIKVSYDDFFPTFDLSKYIKKVALREISPVQHRIDIYLPSAPRHFNSTDALFTRKMNKYIEGKIQRPDFLDFSSMEFITNKASGAEDLMLYRYSEFTLEKVATFDGSYIITYLALPECNGVDIVEKYKTDELTEKYRTMAPKSNVVDLEAAMRKISNN